MSVATDGKGLLQAIIDDPADDVPRLAFADWLEEAGDDARAEFVRLQLRLDRPAAIGAAGGRVILWRELSFSAGDRGREATLLAAHPAHPRWLGRPDPLPEHPRRHVLSGRPTIECLGSGRVECTFRRGFVDEISCTLAAWRTYGPSIVRGHPVTVVRLTDKAPVPTSAGRFAWAVHDRDGPPPWRLPDWLATAFDRPAPVGFIWPDREAAVLACSRGLINWAKGQPHGA